MNDDHRLDTAIRQMVTEQLDQQPAPVAWDEIDVGHTITWDSTTSGDRRWLLGAAAALILLLGAGMLWLRPGDAREAEPSASADPIEAPGFIALSQVDQLTDDQWVVPTMLPDDVEYLYSLTGSSHRFVSYGASEVVRLSITVDDAPFEDTYWSTDDGRVGTGASPDERPVADPGTALDWSVRARTGGWHAQFEVGTSQVRVSANDDFNDAAVATLNSLNVVDASELPHPPFDTADGSEYTRVAVGDRVTLGVQRSGGFLSTTTPLGGAVGTTCCVEITDGVVALAHVGSSTSGDDDRTETTVIWAMARPEADSLMIDIPGDGQLLADLSDAEVHDGWKYWVTTEEFPRELLENGPGELPVQAFDADGNLIE